MYNTQITSGRLGDYPYGVSLPLIKEGQSYSGPLQSHIETISASVEQPRLTPYRAGPSGSGRAYPHSSAQAAESHPGTSHPWVNGSAAGFKISENDVSKKLNTADPLQAFILNPHNHDKQLALYTRLACKDLPDFFKNAKITENAVPIRNFLGIITKDVQPEDRALFNKCCVKVMRADDVNKECKIGDSIGHLINKYGVESMNKFVDAYSYCCLIAWRHYNPGYEGTPTPEEIYDERLPAVQEYIHRTIQLSASPDEGWVEKQVDDLFLKKWCCSLSDILKIDTGIKLNSGSLSEDFDKIFMSEPQDPALQFNLQEYDAAHRPSVFKGFLHCLESVLCCGV